MGKFQALNYFSVMYCALNKNYNYIKQNKPAHFLTFSLRRYN